VTQPGSFPGRPRGRRARREADVPEGEGYAATPPDEREFPDLPPIRPSQARPRDARGQGDWRGQPGQPGQYGPQGQGGQPAQGGYGGGYPAGSPGYGQSGPGQAGSGYNGGQDGAGQSGGGQSGGGRHGAGQYGGGQSGGGRHGTGQYGGQQGAGQQGAGQYGADQYSVDQYSVDQYNGGQRGAGQYSPEHYSPGQYNGGQYGGGLAAGGQADSGQAPWPDQDWQPQPPAGQSPGQPGPASAQPVQPLEVQQAGPSQQSQPQWADAQPGRPEEDVPSWAEPDSVEAFSARWHRRGLDSRDDRRTDRRKRRRSLFAIGGALAVVIAVAVYFLAFDSSGGSANLGLGSLVTQFLPGEVQSVPDACGTVPSATLSQYLPGTPKQAAPPLNSGTNTECSWTLDNAPTYRVLQVQIVAYTPSALVANPNGSGLVPAGNGSATYAAEAGFASSEYTLANPTADSGQPKATIAALSGMPGGNDTSAFSATQVFNKNGQSDDATVYVRYRNVIVTASLQGLNQTTGAKKYGPVSMSDLTAAAKVIAREVIAKIV
jgi:hypothetical protein